MRKLNKSNNAKVNTKSVVESEEIIEEEDNMRNLKTGKKFGSAATIGRKPMTKKIIEDDIEEENDDMIEEEIENVDVEEEEENIIDIDIDEEEVDDESEEDDSSNDEEDEKDEEENEEDEEEEVKPIKKTIKKATTKKEEKKIVKKPKKIEHEEDEEEETDDEKVKIEAPDFGKGVRFYDPKYNDSSFESTKFGNREKSLNRLVKRLSSNEVTKDIFDKCDSAESKKNVAANIINEFFMAILDTNLIDNSGFPIGNAVIKVQDVPTKLYKKFGERMTQDVLKLGHSKLTLTGGEYKKGFGCVYSNNGISELSVAGEADDEKFVSNVTTEFNKAGDIFDIESGEILDSKPKKVSKKSGKKIKK